MKSYILFLMIGINVAGYPVASAQVPGQKNLPDQQSKYAKEISQVKAGTLKTAYASWWGFDSADATKCLQDAINSGVSELIVDNTGTDWLINKTINLVSNQQIIFEDGVVIQAKEGYFRGKSDCLFKAQQLTNISLIGHQGNAMFRMCKADYSNPKLYTRGEWRHGISLSDCSNVIISGLIITKTGGDGLYLGGSNRGYNKNVLVENCIFDDNYRQGISVISAEDLTIRHCKLINTSGTNPQCGIDFEPNSKGQRLVNCRLEDCVLSGNNSNGLSIYTVHFDSSSLPISISLNNCFFSGNALGGIVSTITESPDAFPRAQIILNNCFFDHNGINLQNALVKSTKYVFRNCELDFTDQPGRTVSAWTDVPVAIHTLVAAGSAQVGGITFDQMKVRVSKDMTPVALRFHGEANLSDQITGSILLEKDCHTTTFDLAKHIQQRQAVIAESRSLKPAVFNRDILQAPATGKPRQNNEEFYTRDRFAFLQYAKKGEQVTLNVTSRKVNASETEVELHDPNGQLLRKYAIPYNSKPFPITFVATQTGLYSLIRTQGFSQRIDINSNTAGNGFRTDNKMSFMPLKGKLYFEVPAGVKHFALSVRIIDLSVDEERSAPFGLRYFPSSDSTADIALINPEGKIIQCQNAFNSINLLSAERVDPSKAEIWSVFISSHASWAVDVNLKAPLQPIVSTNPATLLRRKQD